ncbi:MAG: CoA transferase [Alphaproteobacteria bacterium]|jgi:CoA:oxalate CoA-transferase|nr:CoA transferase [Alphaproteobacteria bacterium]MDP6517812.1 CoA transferase [Alphaproteobacteria bacterium]
MAAPRGALDGLKVLDLSRYVAGPYCAMLLGDLGADVVKVEKPETGEDVRQVPPLVGGDSLFVMMFNRNKRSITVDTRDSRGQALIRELAGEADILVENFRPGVMEAMGCGWEVLAEANPRLIMARISGWGQDGPHAARPSFDAIAQAASGLMEMTGPADGPATLAGTTVIDHSTGLHALIGILAALAARQRTGCRQLIDTALFDSALSMLMTAIPAHALLDEPTPRDGNRDRYGAPANTFDCAGGGQIHIMAGGDTRFARFARAAGLDWMLEDERFATGPARRENVEVLERTIEAWTRTCQAEALEELLATAGVPCAKLRSIGELIDHPQVRHREQIIEIDHPVAGKVPMQGFVAKLSATPSALRKPVPRPGQHSAEVLADWLGWDSARIAALAEPGKP